MKVQDALVDAHLEAIVGVGTLTTRRLADQELEDLGGHSHGAGHLKVLVKSLVLQLGADLLNSLYVSGGKGDADAVNHLAFGLGGLNNSNLIKVIKNNRKKSEFQIKIYLGGLDRRSRHFS